MLDHVLPQIVFHTGKFLDVVQKVVVVLYLQSDLSRLVQKLMNIILLKIIFTSRRYTFMIFPYSFPQPLEFFQDLTTQTYCGRRITFIKNSTIIRRVSQGQNIRVDSLKNIDELLRGIEFHNVKISQHIPKLFDKFESVLGFSYQFNIQITQAHTRNILLSKLQIFLGKCILVTGSTPLFDNLKQFIVCGSSTEGVVARPLPKMNITAL